MRRVLLAWLIGLLVQLAAQADSPVTSTDFWAVYSDIPQVQQAHEKKRLDAALVEFLLSNAPLDHKAAAINALAWDYQGVPRNWVFFREKLAEKYKLDPDQVEPRLTSQESFCLGYITARDSHGSPSFAVPLLKTARKGLPRSFTVALVATIVDAQVVRSQWDKIWPITQKTLRDKSLKMDMRPQARDEILKYMRLYEKHAK